MMPVVFVFYFWAGAIIGYAFLGGALGAVLGLLLGAALFTILYIR